MRKLETVYQHLAARKFNAEVSNMNKLNQHPSCKRIGLVAYLRSPSTSGRSLVMAMTNANNVTKVVMKATDELQVEIDSVKMRNFQEQC